ncbi:MAG TPA: TetR/AcrR family transcriptional regulator [Mucilaginibacter sp.]|jgi:AcrR family transcriptional regulator
MKEQIVETSLKLFLADGIKSNTMQKLATTMGISTKTMYKFFVDKEALLEECLKVHYHSIDKTLMHLTIGAPNYVVSIWNVYAKVLELDFGINRAFYHDLNYYYPELQDKVMRLDISNATNIMTRIIKHGMEEGYFLSYLQPLVVLEALTVLYTSITRGDVYKNSGLKPDDLFAHTIVIYLRGICTEKGLKIINQLTN